MCEGTMITIKKYFHFFKNEMYKCTYINIAMGIHDLFKVPVANEEHANHGETLGDIGEFIEFKDLEGHRISVDTSDYIYNSLLAMGHVSALTDPEGRPTAHIQRIYLTVLGLHKAGVKQIWIFDSPKPNKFKKFEQEKRKARRVQGEQSGNEKQAFVINSQIVGDIKTLLTLMGINYIEAPEGIEAEHYGAFLTAGPIGERYCTYMLSADSDVLAFGGNLLRHSTKKSATGKSKKTVYRVYELDDVLNALDIDYDQFLQLCVSLGTDFQESKIKGVGPKTVVKKIKDEKIEFSEAHEEVMSYFKNPPPTDGADIKENKLDPAGFREFMLSRNFAESRIDDALAILQA
jgi:flap endonuclease-1